MIVAARDVEPITTTSRLVDLVKGAIPRARWEARLHPATRTFQALRIAVNEELQSLERGLVAGIESLKKGGRIVVISFHSLEDRIVKNVFNEFARGCICPKSVPRCVCGKVPVLRKVTGKPVIATPDEIAANPRSRSAKLRAAEKL
jgi:16S rRNA (cytosine1402-N4)-methyltransferase